MKSQLLNLINAARNNGNLGMVSLVDLSFEVCCQAGDVAKMKAALLELARERVIVLVEAGDLSALSDDDRYCAVELGERLFVSAHAK